MSKTATPGACKRSAIDDIIQNSQFLIAINYRFADAVRAWSGENVEQCKRRSRSQYPSVEEYIDIRRKTIGQGTVEGPEVTLLYFWLISHRGFSYPGVCGEGTDSRLRLRASHYDRDITSYHRHTDMAQCESVYV